MILYSINAAIALVVPFLIYAFLHKKTNVSYSLIVKDILFVQFASLILGFICVSSFSWLSILATVFSIPMLVFLDLMIRFFRKPKRVTDAGLDDVISAADGNVIYIKRIEPNKVPISIKNSTIAKLEELTKTDILKQPCWLVGINMTPYDVHNNCAPVSGEIVLNKHFDGKFLSLKLGEALVENERNTMVFKRDDGLLFGMVQIASKRVRRIVSYKDVGDSVKRGEYVGMIKFGSQVDLIIPDDFKILVNLKDQVYAGKTIIATRK